ncbi:hypothetical protein [Brucella suis]|uniref:hypothetical protein n=1 Tax=Brucella suis TaxID=29461 RepID=UPI0001BA0E48|nr:hypothetical protein [Brucella suis]EEY28389.1 predicted protein [Brucella suis bv. 5 str. 513]QOK68418.1 hypothetical protein HUZ31_12230 [Brucella suis bv. 5]
MAMPTLRGLTLFSPPPIRRVTFAPAGLRTVYAVRCRVEPAPVQSIIPEDEKQFSDKIVFKRKTESRRAAHRGIK